MNKVVFYGSVIIGLVVGTFFKDKIFVAFVLISICIFGLIDVVLYHQYNKSNSQEVKKK